MRFSNGQTLFDRNLRTISLASTTSKELWRRWSPCRACSTNYDRRRQLILGKTENSRGSQCLLIEFRAQVCQTKLFGPSGKSGDDFSSRSCTQRAAIARGSRRSALRLLGRIQKLLIRADQRFDRVLREFSDVRHVITSGPGAAHFGERIVPLIIRPKVSDV